MSFALIQQSWKVDRGGRPTMSWEYVGRAGAPLFTTPRAASSRTTVGSGAGERVSMETTRGNDPSEPAKRAA
jgi:hypothetical protein